jgi:hypothetical protein
MHHDRIESFDGIVGLCKGCTRRMGGIAARAEISGVVAPSGEDLGYCVACATFRRRYPDRDLADASHGASLKVLAERPLKDWTWRDEAACRGVDHALFDIAMDVFDGTDQPPHVTPPAARAVADQYCLFCPVAAQCGEEADEHRYEGLFAGIWRWTPHENIRIYRTRDLLADLRERAA